VHISEGILPPTISIGGYIVSAVVTGITIKKVSLDDVPKISLVTAAFFVSTFIHIKLGPTSIHLTLNGLMGIILGISSFPAILVALFLQAVLFQHGGILPLGINVFCFGIPALISHYLFQFTFTKFKAKLLLIKLIGGLSGGLAVAISGVMLALVLIMSGKEFTTFAYFFAWTHIVLMFIESLLTFLVLNFILKVKPELIKSSKLTL